MVIEITVAISASLVLLWVVIDELKKRKKYPRPDWDMWEVVHDKACEEMENNSTRTVLCPECDREVYVLFEYPGTLTCCFCKYKASISTWKRRKENA